MARCPTCGRLLCDHPVPLEPPPPDTRQLAFDLDQRADERRARRERSESR